jgi:hypothetical protein
MSKITVSIKDLKEICHSALNDTEYGNDDDPYIKKIRRIANKFLDRIEELDSGFFVMPLRPKRQKSQPRVLRRAR